MKWFLIILLVILIIILIIVVKNYKVPRLNYINGISGTNGSGKTASCVCRVIALLRSIYFLWKSKKIKNDYIVLSNFPIGKLEKKTGKRYLKIFFKKIYCYDLNLEVLTLQERLPQNEVILIVDEFSTIASALDFNNNIVKDNIKEFTRLFRHYTNGLGYFFWLDQCSNEIFNPVRRRTAFVYNMVSFKKLWLLPICTSEYRKILLSDEVDNIIDIEKGTEETELKKFIFFSVPFKYYDSHCHSDRYLAVSKITELKNCLTLKRNDTLKLPKTKALYYETLKYDAICEEDYYKETLKLKDYEKLVDKK